MPPGLNPSRAIFAVFVMLTFYGLGAGYLESFVNYPLWHVIGQTDRWIAYHQALGPRILVVLAIPALILSLAANVLLLFRRPPSIPRWTVWTALALLVVATISTALVQIPLQIQLDAGYHPATVDRLITTSLWLRDVPGAVRAALVGYMLMLALAPSGSAG